MIGKGWKSCIVAATGPSLTPNVADLCRGHRVIAVNDAYRLLPFADVLFATDPAWWDLHKDCDGFAGEKWSSHGGEGDNDKRACAMKYRLNLVQGKRGDGFSFKYGVIHHGGNSGFDAVNLALQFDAKCIYLVGFDMKGSHFFGNHPDPLRNALPKHMKNWCDNFEKAAEKLPEDVRIYNATPDSALTCFPFVDLGELNAKAA